MRMIPMFDSATAYGRYTAPADKPGGSGGQKKTGDKGHPGMDRAFTDKYPKHGNQQQRQGGDSTTAQQGQNDQPSKQADADLGGSRRRHDPNSYRGGSSNKG